MTATTITYELVRGGYRARDCWSWTSSNGDAGSSWWLHEADARAEAETKGYSAASVPGHL